MREGPRTPPRLVVRVPNGCGESQVPGWCCPDEEGSEVKELEMLSLPDFLPRGSLQTLQTPALLFYKLTFGRKGRASAPRGGNNYRGLAQSRGVGG